jgi:hypothetical protein
LAHTPLQQSENWVQAWPPWVHWPATQRSAPLQEKPLLHTEALHWQVPALQLSPKLQGGLQFPPLVLWFWQTPFTQFSPAQQAMPLQLCESTEQLAVVPLDPLEPEPVPFEPELPPPEEPPMVCPVPPDEPELPPWVPPEPFPPELPWPDPL